MLGSPVKILSFRVMFVGWFTRIWLTRHGMQCWTDFCLREMSLWIFLWFYVNSKLRRGDPFTDSRLFGVAIQMNTNTCVCRLNLFIYEVVVFFQGTSLFLFFNRLWTLAKSIIRFCKRKPGISPILNQRSFQRVCCLKTREKETLFTITPAARIRNEMVCPSPRLACHNQSLFQRLRGE